ncbi:TniQ family protein [Pseudoalteromonas piscicida]|uniref:TnsD family transposase n=1 Tax=Pseudoalteromonas piscicida TaxID=43662 RepID=UPI001D0AF0CC|nr:TnsD family transposase [Pseudoalteromonas piscicida]UDM62911.1 TniQ family protein [Pseudoalteromonas piscicida]
MENSTYELFHFLGELQIGHSRFSTFYGLKYCPQCVVEDLDKYGFTYWHVNHQIPGTEACYRHSCLLHATAMGEGQRDRALFLPSFEVKHSSSADQYQIKFASFSAELMTTLQTKNANFLEAYRQLLDQQGLISNNGKNLRISEILKLASNYWKGLKFSEIGVPTVLNNFAFIGPILRNMTNSPAHPLKHILLAAFLTNNDVSLLFKRKRIISNVNTKAEDDSKIDQVLTLLKNGKSLNEIEKLTGRSRCYVRRIAELNRIPHKSNSLKYSDDIRRTVLIKAMYGISCDEIANQLQVGIGYVEQVICNEPNMSKWRKHLRVQKRILAASQRLEAICKKSPSLNRTQIRKLAEADYFILYNHDKSLIENILPKPLKPKRYYKDWEKEDSRLFNAISKIEDIELLSLSAIGRLVNDHSYILRSIDKLPKTRQLLVNSGKIINK